MNSSVLTIVHGSAGLQARVGPVLGTGSSSIVVRGTEIGGQERELVIKVLRDRHECLRDELRAFRRIRRRCLMGQGVPELIASGPVLEEHRAPALVFRAEPDLVPLHRHLRSVGRMPEDQVVVIARRLLRILSRLHTRCRILHADIKTDNVLLNPRTLEVQLIDFGIATRLHRPRYLRRARSYTTTAYHGVHSNTPPESLLRGTRLLGPEYDVWKVGCMLHACLMGHEPFEGVPDGAADAEVPAYLRIDAPWQIPLAERILSGSFASSPLITAHAARFLRRCLTVNPADRPLPAELLRDSWLAIRI